MKRTKYILLMMTLLLTVLCINAFASDVVTAKPEFTFDDTVYKKRVYFGFDKSNPESPLKLGPNIADWPKMSGLTEDILLKVVSVIKDPVTTTDELIPSGETSPNGS